MSPGELKPIKGSTADGMIPIEPEYSHLDVGKPREFDEPFKLFAHNIIVAKSSVQDRFVHHHRKLERWVSSEKLLADSARSNPAICLCGRECKHRLPAVHDS